MVIAERSANELAEIEEDVFKFWNEVIPAIREYPRESVSFLIEVQPLVLNYSENRNIFVIAGNSIGSIIAKMKI